MAAFVRLPRLPRVGHIQTLSSKQENVIRAGQLAWSRREVLLETSWDEGIAVHLASCFALRIRIPGKDDWLCCRCGELRMHSACSARSEIVRHCRIGRHFPLTSVPALEHAGQRQIRRRKPTCPQVSRSDEQSCDSRGITKHKDGPQKTGKGHDEVEQGKPTRSQARSSVA